MPRVSLWLACCILGVLNMGCAEDTVSQSYTLTSCQSINLTGGLDVDWSIVPSSSGKAIIEAPQKVLEQLVVNDQPAGFELPNGRAKVSIACTCPQKLQLLGSVALEAPCGVAELRVYGSSSAKLSGGNASDVELRASGAANAIYTELDADALTVSASGDARLVLSGTAAELTLSTIGRAEVDAAALRVQTVSVRARGTSRVHVTPTAHLMLDAAETAVVEYASHSDLSLSVPEE